MLLKSLLIAASLSSPVCAQQTPPFTPPDASSSSAKMPTVDASTTPQPTATPAVSLELVREELAKPPPI